MAHLKVSCNNEKTDVDNSEYGYQNPSRIVISNPNAESNLKNEVSDDTEESVVIQGPLLSDIVLLEHELELLHISRQDNPYLQLLSSSQDNLDTDGGEKTDSSSVFSPEPPFSPVSRSSCGGVGKIS